MNNESAHSGFSEMSLHLSLVKFLAFSLKSSWKPPKGHPNLEVFLSQLENEIFKMPFDNLKHSNESKVKRSAGNTTFSR